MVQNGVEDGVFDNAAEHSSPDVCTDNSQTEHNSPQSTSLAVPRESRRGLLGRLALISEIQQPRQYKTSVKWTITATVSISAAAGPIASSIFYPALPALSRDFEATKTITSLSVALYLLSTAICPLWWSSLAEKLGRRSVYLVSFSLNFTFNILGAISTNMAMLIVFRTCAGGASASALAVGAGTVADIWDSSTRGRAMSLFDVGPILGPLIAPILSGILSQRLGWRSIMWLLAIFGFFCFLLLLLFLPETLTREQTSVTDELQHQQRLEDATTTSAQHRSSFNIYAIGNGIRIYMIEPLTVVRLLRFPPIAITVVLVAISFWALYTVNIVIQQTYAQVPYSYSQTAIGLLYIPTSLGNILAACVGGKWIDYIIAREARKANRYDEKGNLVLLPEDRIRENMWGAITVYPLALLSVGWTLQYGVIWIAPSIGLFFFGLASMLVFASAATTQTELVHRRSSAGVAVSNLVRNLISCVGTVVATPWIDAVGVGWVGTISCIVCMVVGLSAAIALRIHANRWRKGMDEKLAKIGF